LSTKSNGLICVKIELSMGNLALVIRDRELELQRRRRGIIRIGDMFRAIPVVVWRGWYDDALPVFTSLRICTHALLLRPIIRE
jgi:hypothetical protein